MIYLIDIAILIPCYNEANTISKMIKDLKRVFPRSTVYVYDNGSTDGTDKLADLAGAIVRYVHKKGKGNVMRKMFEDIDARCYIMTDGDDPCPAEELKAMADIVLSEDIDMVVGDRLSSTYFQQNRRPLHGFGNMLVPWLAKRLFKSNVTDAMSGVRAMSYQFVKSFADDAKSKGFELETEMTIFAARSNAKIQNFIISFRDRDVSDGSESKVKTIIDGIRILRTILWLYLSNFISSKLTLKHLHQHMTPTLSERKEEPLGNDQ